MSIIYVYLSIPTCVYTYIYICVYVYIYILSKYTYYVVSGLGRGLLQTGSHVDSKPKPWSSRLPAQLSIHYRPGCEALTPPARWLSDQRLVTGTCVTCPQSSDIKSVANWGKNNMIWKVPTHLFVQTSHKQACHGQGKTPPTGVFLHFASPSFFWFFDPKVWRFDDAERNHFFCS